MSTLNSSRAGSPLAHHGAATEPDESLSSQVFSIPRCAHDTTSSSQASSGINASVQADMPGYRNLHIEFPACSQSSLSMELTHDGKVTEVIARFESYANYSDESKEPHTDSTHAYSIATHCPSEVEAQTVRGSGDEHSHTIEAHGLEQQSPRKPIPAHWLPKNHGPNLATARRAKERSHKTEGHGLGATVMTIRGTRSSFELGKHSTENTTFLTKEALAAVENNLATTTSHSPSRVHQSPSRQSRPSPNVSPQRNNTHQASKFTIIKMSPTRRTFLNADLVPSGHSRASSSVTTSVGGNSFHTAEGSPVRSCAGSDVSFESAAEILEDIDTGHDEFGANSENAQGVQGPKKGSTSPLKAAAEFKSSTVKPRLSLVIPPSPYSEPDEQATRALNSVASNSNMIVTPSNQNPPGQTSRIPRVSATNKTGSARGATRSSTLKRVQSVKSLSPKTKAPEDHSVDQVDSKVLNTSAAESPHRVRTVDSSGTTPILSSTSIVNDTTYPYSTGYDPRTDNVVVQTKSSELKMLVPNDHATVSAETSIEDDPTVSKNPSRATGSTPMEPPSPTQDVILGTKCDVLGTRLTCPSNILQSIAMMAHKFDLGTSDEGNVSHGKAPLPDEPSCAVTVVENTSPVRGRTERYLPGVRRQAESQHSMESSLGSDLRATAPEFVPQARATQHPNVAPADPVMISLPEPGTDQDIFGLDKHGIPWVYYMYPIQFAYEQGFRNGRSKSPRKFRQRKQKSLISSPNDVQNQPQRVTFSATDIRPEADPSFSVTQRQSDAILMPPPPIPVHRFQGVPKGENSHPSLAVQQHLDSKTSVDQKTSTFAPQANLATQQPALDGLSNHNTPQFSNFRSAAMHGVPFRSGPRDIKAPRYNTVSYRGPRHTRRHAGNGLYSGRGAAGVPMDATFPFPDPMPPQGRPDQSQIYHGSPQQHAEYTVGTEACGVIDVYIAAERGGGEACNACAPDH